MRWSLPVNIFAGASVFALAFLATVQWSLQ